eukprot:CAMPEP_0183555676 /NCGR_PEP_ID=MMETSP0371-20130417/80164_1 /TAXON_ID=268820 /ORGANISM="Peridinium aciculiferum, Strain PAER-2" /LENGTH=34 /DNA_ID= /DNA_START= /DNA_END= /DNA_ORIENTATION=
MTAKTDSRLNVGRQQDWCQLFQKPPAAWLPNGLL